MATGCKNRTNRPDQICGSCNAKKNTIKKELNEVIKNPKNRRLGCKPIRGTSLTTNRIKELRQMELVAKLKAEGKTPMRYSFRNKAEFGIECV